MKGISASLVPWILFNQVENNFNISNNIILIYILQTHTQAHTCQYMHMHT